jgi:hypothetical protein
MASGAKRKTTMAKLNRERKVLEKRHAKAARKDARKREAAAALEPGYVPPEPEGAFAEDSESAASESAASESAASSA